MRKWVVLSVTVVTVLFSLLAVQSASTANAAVEKASRPSQPPFDAFIVIGDEVVVSLDHSKSPDTQIFSGRYIGMDDHQVQIWWEGWRAQQGQPAEHVRESYVFPLTSVVSIKKVTHLSAPSTQP